MGQDKRGGEVGRRKKDFRWETNGRQGTLPLDPMLGIHASSGDRDKSGKR